VPLEPRGKPRSATRVDEGKAVLCRACRAEIASARDRIALGDGSPHTFVNPHGFVFRLVGFADAPGCVELGRPSRHFSWFPGCAWQVALCRTCEAHLGWRFSGVDTFWGLIEDRIDAAGADPG
jgi:hypothetical protein